MTDACDLTGILHELDLNDQDREKLLRLFEFAQYLFDDDENLTKTMNLNKNARDQLVARMCELFESGLEEEGEK